MKIKIIPTNKTRAPLPGMNEEFDLGPFKEGTLCWHCLIDIDAFKSCSLEDLYKTYKMPEGYYDDALNLLEIYGYIKIERSEK
jgi:hypothetical protein